MTIQQLRAKVQEKDLTIKRLKEKVARKEGEISFLIDLLDRRQLDEYEDHLKEVMNKLKNQK